MRLEFRACNCKVWDAGFYRCFGCITRQRTRVVCAVLPKKALRCHSPQEGGLKHSTPCLKARTPDHAHEAAYPPSFCARVVLRECMLRARHRYKLHGSRTPQAVNPQHWLPSWMGQKSAPFCIACCPGLLLFQGSVEDRPPILASAFGAFIARGPSCSTCAAINICMVVLLMLLTILQYTPID